MNWDNPTEVLKALKIVYQNQTADEVFRRGTIHDNGVGFNSVDASVLTPICVQLFEHGKPISSKQYEMIRSMIRKYHAQITDSLIDQIDLKESDLIYTSKDKVNSDGIIDVNDGVIQFKPFVFPSNQAKELGFKWRNPYWIAPYDPAKVRSLVEMFPKAVKSNELIELEHTLGNPPVIDTFYNPSLKLFQKQGVSFANTFRRSLIALAPGLGKSAVAIEAAMQIGGKVLIVSPLTLMMNWRAEIKKWTGQDAQIWHQRLGRSSQWVITNYESILALWTNYDIQVVERGGKKRRELINWECIVDHDFDVLIVDESILIKNRKAQRTNAIFQLAQTVDNVFLLSGSPVSRLYDDMWSQLHVLLPSRYTSYWKFAQEYCHVVQTQWGWQIQANRAEAEVNLKQDLADVMFARTQAQVTDIPDWIFDNYDIEMPKEQYRMYQEMERDFRTMLPDGDEVVASIILTQLLRLVQIASNPLLIGGSDISAKWNSVPELLEFLELPAIIWTRFKMTADLLAKKLSKNFRVASLTGDTPAISRQPIVDRFQGGDLDIIVAHPGVGKYGLTLTRARTAIYLERGYSGDDYYQSLYRVKRIGTEHSPHVIHLLSCRPDNPNAPTVDHVIHRILEYRKNNSIAITSGMIREAFERRWE